MTPRRIHHVAAVIEMFTWAGLIGAMVLKYSGTTEAPMPFAGGIHGFGFLTFLLVNVLVWTNNRWPAGIGLLGFVVTVIPFAALPFANYTARKGLVDGPWRFSAADTSGTEPTTLVDKVLAFVVRQPVKAIVLGLIGVTIVFCILLLLGPPVDVESAVGANT